MIDRGASRSRKIDFANSDGDDHFPNALVEIRPPLGRKPRKTHHDDHQQARHEREQVANRKNKPQQTRRRLHDHDQQSHHERRTDWLEPTSTSPPHAHRNRQRIVNQAKTNATVLETRKTGILGSILLAFKHETARILAFFSWLTTTVPSTTRSAAKRAHEQEQTYHERPQPNASRQANKPGEQAATGRPPSHRERQHRTRHEQEKICSKHKRTNLGIIADKIFSTRGHSTWIFGRLRRAQPKRGKSMARVELKRPPKRFRSAWMGAHRAKMLSQLVLDARIQRICLARAFERCQSLLGSS